MTSTLTAPQPSTAKHGTVTYYSSPGLAAQQASLDMAAYAAKAATSKDTAAPGDTAEIAAAGITALGTSVLALISAGQLGASIGSMVGGGAPVAGQLQLTVTNYSSQPVVPFDYQVLGGFMSNVPNPLTTGETDTYMMTSPQPFDDASFRFDFLVGTGPAPTGIGFSLWLKYGTSSPWTTKVKVDDDDEHPFDPARQMFGFTFTATKDTAAPKFSAYFTPIESANGVVSLMICDKG
jgi:hypothetical protein